MISMCRLFHNCAVSIGVVMFTVFLGCHVRATLTDSQRKKADDFADYLTHPCTSDITMGTPEADFKRAVEVFLKTVKGSSVYVANKVFEQELGAFLGTFAVDGLPDALKYIIDRAWSIRARQETMLSGEKSNQNQVALIAHVKGKMLDWAMTFKTNLAETTATEYMAVARLAVGEALKNDRERQQFKNTDPVKAVLTAFNQQVKAEAEVAFYAACMGMIRRDYWSDRLGNPVISTTLWDKKMAKPPARTWTWETDLSDLI